MSQTQTPEPILPITTAVAAEPAPNSSLDNCLNVCIPCSGCALAVGLAAAYVANIVYSIMALVETSHKELQSMCSGTNLWIYLLIILIVGFGNNRQVAKELAAKETSFCITIFIMAAQLGMLSWGTYELAQGGDCGDELTSNLIYTMVFINVVTSWVLIGVFMVYIIGVIVIFCKK